MHKENTTKTDLANYTLEELMVINPRKYRKYRNRICASCGKHEITTSKTDICAACTNDQDNLKTQQEQIAHLESFGYYDIAFDRYESKKARYNLRAPCCGQQQNVRYNNITASISARPDLLPCSHCGATNRMRYAQSVYIDTYGHHNWQNVDHSYYDQYKGRVRRVSEKVYEMYRNEINPLNLVRGRGYQNDGSAYYQLDHIVSISFCFKHGVHPVAASDKRNMQMILSDENAGKHWISTTENAALLKELMEKSIDLYNRDVPWNVPGVDEKEEKRMAALCVFLLPTINAA